MLPTDAEDDLLTIGYNMATEKSYVNLFDMVLESCLKFTNADGGSLYIVDEESKNLIHLLDANHQLDFGSKQSIAQADMQMAEDKETNLFTYTYHHNRLLNIADIYTVKEFDVISIREFDARNGYRTKSVLMAPISIKDRAVLGVMMLYNCRNEEGEVVPFNWECERAVVSLTSQMASNLTNMTLIQDLEELLGSFVECMTTAIDTKTPYNANHTRHVAKYCMEICEQINALHTRGECEIFISENDKEQLHMAAMLHDIGKIVIHRGILDKASRLSELEYEKLYNKLEWIRLMLKIDMLEGRFDESSWAMEDIKLTNFCRDLHRMNIAEMLTKTDLDRIEDMAGRVYVSPIGERFPYLNEKEKKALNIKQGTLTDEERRQIQEHVVYTNRILDKIKFTDKYSKVQSIAANHHEYLDGSGYPNGLKAEQLDILTRILTVCDIFDSLTAEDRPYKGPMPLDQAIKILKDLAKRGKLDEKIVTILSDYMMEHFVKETSPLLLQADAKSF